MADEYVCPECGWTSEKEESCPFCEAKLEQTVVPDSELAYAEDGATDDMYSVYREDFDPDAEELMA